jgi:hypothetical protein
MTCMCADEGVRKDIQLFSEPCDVKTMVVRPRTLAECSKKVIYTFTRPSYSSHTTPSIMKDTTTVSKTGHTIAAGLAMLRV